VPLLFAPALKSWARCQSTQTTSSTSTSAVPPPPALPAQHHKQESDIAKQGEAKPLVATKEHKTFLSNEKSAERAGLTRPTSDPKSSRWARIKATVKKEALHYWHGTRLLGKEVKISTRLLLRLMRGNRLTRREHRQLKRTTNDLLRLIPFSVFVLVPFMELLLPVALKLFPNMLPSTFTDKYKEDEKKRKLLKVRIEMAKFLQETLKESGVKSPNKIVDSAEFKEFFRKVRSTGEQPSTDDIVKTARLFEDDLTLDNLSRPQLVSLCRYLNINAYGTDQFLRHTIRARMAKIREDDKVIEDEGIESLQDAELAAACQSRAIRSTGVPIEKQRENLAQWIDLHVHRELSGTLLILSRAFSFNEANTTDGHLVSLKNTLSSLPDALLNETEMEVSGDQADFKKKLEVLEEQEELIEDEAEQEEREASDRAARKEEAEKEERLKQEEAEHLKTQEEKEKAQDVSSASEAKAAIEAEDADDVRMTSEQIDELGAALSILSAKSSVLQEREELKKLMEENQKTQADADEQDSTVSGLAKRIKSMIEKVDKQLEEYDAEVGNKMNTIAVGEDGKLVLADLKKALREIRHAPSEDQIDVLVDKLDIDHDGFVTLQEILSLAENEGLGVLLDDQSAAIVAQAQKLKREDVIDDK